MSDFVIKIGYIVLGLVCALLTILNCVAIGFIVYDANSSSKSDEISVKMSEAGTGSSIVILTILTFYCIMKMRGNYTSKSFGKKR